MSAITTELFYTRIGNGSKYLLLFHGFGQDHSVFISIAHALSDQYTCYLFDIYFHGKSRWSADEKPLEKEEWKNIIGSILRENNIQEFSLFGYSMGAKFAFATLEAFPQQVKQLMLVAPDGIKTSRWYSLATYPTVMRNFFRSMINHHSRFLGIARVLSQLRMMDRGLIRFAELQMNTEERRKRVYYSWVVFRHLSFDMESIAALINEHSIELVVVAGKYDKVIRPGNMNQLLRHTPRHRFVVLDVGHNNLIGDPAIIQLLKA
jgi:pimeloyl-ACP methyl ester carboxylesterase